MNEDLPLFRSAVYGIDPSFPFHIERNVHDRYTRLQLHAHEFVELVYVVGGTAKHRIRSAVFGEQRYEISSGDILIVNQGEEHTYELAHDERLEIVNLLFAPEFVDDSYLHAPGQSQLLDFFYVQPYLKEPARFASNLKLGFRGAGEIEQIIGKIENEFGARRLGYQALIRLSFNELIVRLSRFYSESVGTGRNRDVHSGANEYIRRVVGYVERRYQTDIEISHLAKLACCSERQLTRSFRQATGESVVRFVHALRIEKAKALLVRYGDTVAEIGAVVGFRDAAYFIKVFKRLTGMTPKEYRMESQLAQSGE